MRRSDLVSRTVRTVSTKVSKYGPQILTGIGIVGMATSAVMIGKATPKALALIEEKKLLMNKQLLEEAEAKGMDVCSQVTELKPVEIVQTCWKVYAPSVILMFASSVCLIGANTISLKRISTLAAAYKLSETTLSEYKDAVMQTIGEKKEKEVRETYAENQIKKNPVEANQIFMTGSGDSLCYDPLSGRYFKSNIEKIKKARNDLNEIMINEMYVSLNMFYEEIGLEITDLGRELGWSIDRDGTIDILFTAKLTDDGTPCLVMDFKEMPKYDFDKFVY